jgi:polyhydroxyalkanoate synthase
VPFIPHYKWGFQAQLSKEYAEYFLAFDKWINDPVPFPGGVAKRIVKECYQENKLIKGEMKIGGKSVNLREITCSLLNVAAERDHIAPINSTRVLTELVSSRDKTLMVTPSEHASLIAGRKAREGLWPKLDHWLRTRSN